MHEGYHSLHIMRCSEPKIYTVQFQQSHIADSHHALYCQSLNAAVEDVGRTVWARDPSSLLYASVSFCLSLAGRCL